MNPQMMARTVQKLSIEDKQKYEMQKEMFIIIRLIDMVEKCAQLSDDKIPQDKHCEEITKLLDKYKIFEKQIERFELHKFVKEYGLEDCKFGIERIAAGPPQIRQGNRIQIVVDLMQKFFQIQDTILGNRDNPKVPIFKPLIEQLIVLLTRAKKELPPYNSYLEELKQFADESLSKQIMDVLTEEEVEKMEHIMDLAQNNFMTCHQQK